MAVAAAFAGATPASKDTATSEKKAHNRTLVRTKNLLEVGLLTISLNRVYVEIRETAAGERARTLSPNPALYLVTRRSRGKRSKFLGVFWLAAPVNPKCGDGPVNLQMVAGWARKGKSLKAVELAVYHKGKWRNIAKMLEQS